MDGADCLPRRGTGLSQHDVMEGLVLYPKTVAIAWHAGTSHSSARAVVLYKALAAAASRDGLAILAQSPPVTPVISFSASRA